MKNASIAGVAVLLALAGLAGADLAVASDEARAPDAVAKVDIIDGTAPVCRVVATALAGDARLTILREPDPAWRDVWENAASLIPEWHRSTAISEAEFDFDNDAIADRVTRFEHWDSYQRGSDLMVRLGNADRNAAPLAQETADFSNERYWFLPCQWDRQPIATMACPGFTQDHDEAALDVATPQGPSVRFRARYSDLVPLRYRARSYVVVTALDETAAGFIAVIEPRPLKKFRPVCLFKRTEPEAATD